MTEILEQVRIWLEQIISTLGYTGIILVMFLECIFPPIPSELMMPFAGFMVSQGHFSFGGIVAAGADPRRRRDKLSQPDWYCP